MIPFNLQANDFDCNKNNLLIENDSIELVGDLVSLGFDISIEKLKKAGYTLDDACEILNFEIDSKACERTKNVLNGAYYTYEYGSTVLSAGKAIRKGSGKLLSFIKRKFSSPANKGSKQNFNNEFDLFNNHMVMSITGTDEDAVKELFQSIKKLEKAGFLKILSNTSGEITRHGDKYDKNDFMTRWKAVSKNKTNNESYSDCRCEHLFLPKATVTKLINEADYYVNSNRYFFEGFNYNSLSKSEWKMSSNCYISNGHFNVSGQKPFYLLRNEVDVLTDKNLKVAVSVEYVSSLKKPFFIQLGDYCFVLVPSESKVGITHYKNLEDEDYLQYSSEIYGNKFRLTVKQINGKWYFYVNDKLIIEERKKSSSSTNVQISGFPIIKVNYFSMNGLRRK